MKMGKMGDRYRFVDPSLVSFTGKKDMNERARALASRLKDTHPGQLVLVPCNVGQHWILTAIAPYEEVVYLLDPISHHLREQIVNMSIAIFNANLSKKGKKNPTWEVIKAPLQPDAKQCGYYVMRYMKVIEERLGTNKMDVLRSLFENEEYSIKDIDEVRAEWALRVQAEL